MRISDWSSDVCSSDLPTQCRLFCFAGLTREWDCAAHPEPRPSASLRSRHRVPDALIEGAVAPGPQGNPSLRPKMKTPISCLLFLFARAACRIPKSDRASISQGKGVSVHVNVGMFT